MFDDKIEAKDFGKMPSEYQDLLVRLLTIQADCEIGGPHVYVKDWMLAAPSADEQWNVARMATEEIDHFRRFGRLLDELGVDSNRILFRSKDERQVDTFKETMPTWADFAAFSFLIDRVGRYQLEEMADSSYLPIQPLLPRIMNEERGHIEFGARKLRELVRTEEGRRQAQEAIDRWYPRALDMFGRSASRRSERYIAWGLKKRTNAEARQAYMLEVGPLIADLGLQVPSPLAGRKYL